jgi:4-hydroxythreonine-4-phosphate dehydrogenase
MRLKKNPTLKSSKIRVGLTIGDPSGIGPAIALAALDKLKNKAEFTVIGDAAVLSRAAKILHLRFPVNNVVDLKNVPQKGFAFGKLQTRNDCASLEYLDAALGLWNEKKIDCLVTCPVSKEAINLSGLEFSGHTEYLAQKTGSRDPVMLLLNDRLRFSLLTRHLPLEKVSAALRGENLEGIILNTLKGLKEFFLIKKPRLAFCGVNPHASDNAGPGREEQEIIMPLIKKINKQTGSPAGILLPADTAIARAYQGRYDCVIAAYHDQALIALKLTGFDRGVNLTLGLPVVRTSPLHGVAFDIAAQPAKACPGSLIAAISLAIQCTLNQKKV